MSNKTLNPASESNIERRLEELKKVPARNPLQASSGRARFLNEAAKYRLTISQGKQVRPKKWIFPFQREKLTMNALVALILAAFLLLGSGATVAAAQHELPNQPLYQLKLWTENVDLAIHNDPQERADLLMNMAQTRVQEMAALAEQGITPPDQVRERLQEQLNQVLGIAAALDEPKREQVLLHLRDRLQTQDQIMEKLQSKINANKEPVFTQTRQMLQKHLQLVNEGLADPQEFHYLMQNQNQYGQDEEIAPEPNQQGEPGFHQNEQGDQPVGAPGAGNGNNNAGENQNPGKPDHPQTGNGNGGSDNGSPGGSNSGQGNGNSPGGGGGN